MIRNFNCSLKNCCTKNLSPNYEVYVRIINNVEDLQLMFTLQYMVKDRLITKTSSPFGFKGSERIFYPKTSPQIQIDIYRCLDTEKIILYNITLKEKGIITYELVGTARNPILHRI